MKLGYTLPTLQSDPELPLLAASRAEATGAIDAVFAFDHLFRIGRDRTQRPALDGFTMLAAAAVETKHIGLGTLVARATLRPPAVLANMYATLQRITDGRVIAGLGAGDSASAPEMEAYGLPVGDQAGRVDALAAAVHATRAVGIPTWVGGTSGAVRALAAAEADGWNRWGGTVETYARELQVMAPEVASRPFVHSWGGLVCVDETDAAARAKADRIGVGPDCIVGGPERVAEQLRAYGDAGAEWVILGAVDASNLDNVDALGELVAPLLD